MLTTRRAAAGAAFATAIAAALAFAGTDKTPADDDFSGKTIRIVVGYGPASAYALYGELAARHAGRFIPGHPHVIVSYMPGAAGLKAMNYLYENAPRDGTVIGVPTQDLAAQQALGAAGVRFDAAKFGYIARATASVPVHMVWRTAPAQSIAELKMHEVVTGASFVNGSQADLPRASNALIGTKWKIIAGYQSDATLLAMQRGEIQAAVAAATLFNGRLEPWLDQGMVKIVVQYSDFRYPTLPDVPTILELAKSEEAKGVLEFLVSVVTLGRAYVAPPDLPAGRLAMLRKAFQAMLNDPAFRADAARSGADLLPMSGEELARHVRATVATPPAILRKAIEIIAPK